MNILITGITGFFGRNFVNYLINQKVDCTLIGTAHSECKLAYFKKNFPSIKTYIIDLSSDHFDTNIDAIIKRHKIDYIIHSAAMKHIDICQENPTMALRVNALASEILVNVAKKNNVKNLIALSTDKSNNPCNTYGMAKYIMQESVLANNYSVYQGANFFWSDGSVLDVWFDQYKKNKPLSIRDSNHVRYFNTIDHVCDQIYKNINSHGMVILPDHVYIIRMGTLLQAFLEYFKYDNLKTLEPLNYEKQIEILRDEINNIIPLCKDEIKEKIDTYFKNML